MFLQRLDANATCCGCLMRVLIVEDETEIAKDIATGLDDAGFVTQICDNG